MGDGRPWFAIQHRQAEQKSLRRGRPATKFPERWAEGRTTVAPRTCPRGAVLPARQTSHSSVLQRAMGAAVRWPQRNRVPVPVLPVLEAPR